MVEIILSAFKRLFGSDVRALKWENIVQEIKLKVWAYNMQISVAWVTPAGAGRADPAPHPAGQRPLYGGSFATYAS